MIREKDEPVIEGKPLWETDISPRLFNICRGAEMQTLEDVHRYYIKHGNFRALKDVGKYRNEEFINFLIRYGLVVK